MLLEFKGGRGYFWLEDEGWPHEEGGSSWTRPWRCYDYNTDEEQWALSQYIIKMFQCLTLDYYHVKRAISNQ